MCGDDPVSCVPERLAPDGSVQDGPWQHRAFYAALTREVAKVTQADDADPQAARLDRARRQAAWAGRRVSASVDEDGTGTLTVVTSAFWVAAIKDRLNRAARAARGAGDERTLDQLESDIARILLAHARVGFADQPEPPEQTDGASHSPEDLVRAGWSQELVQALSGLPPAVLQVIVPLLALHDPAQAHTLPGVHRTATTRTQATISACWCATPRPAAYCSTRPGWVSLALRCMTPWPRRTVCWSMAPSGGRTKWFTLASAPNSAAKWAICPRAARAG